MPRVIKFRCWHLYGKHIKRMQFEPAMVYDEKPGDCLRWLAYGQKIESVMQFTGLKDVNGIEIYEGDRLKFVAVSESGPGVTFKDSATGEVQYDSSDAAFYIFSDDEKYPHVMFWHAEDIEVIGNVHELQESPDA